MSITKLFFKKVHPNAQLPTQRSGDAGLDIRCVEDVTIEPGETKKVRTGLALGRYPETTLGSIFLKMEDRSSVALKGVFSVGGIVDISYRGEFHVILHNSSKLPYEAKIGDRVAQAIVYNASFSHQFNTLTCEEVDEIEATERGTGGFGSTGR